MESTTTQTNLDQLVTLEAAASTLSLAPVTLRRWARQGRIRSHTWRLPADVAPPSGFRGGVLPELYVRVREILEDLNAARAAS